MVLRDLGELAVPQQIRPAVPHLPDQEPVPEERQRRNGGAHPALVVLRKRALKDGAIGGADGKAHPLGHLLVVQPQQRAHLAGNDAHGHLTRHLPGRVTAHAVGDDEHPLVGNHEEVVLIPRSDDADVGPARAGDVHSAP